jgi:predicted metal-dependent phosphoesterase TrpH
MHSLFSDGTETPLSLAEKAHALGLSAVALTDHDTTDSHEEMAAACAQFGIELIPGVEISLVDSQASKERPDGSVEQGASVHVLAYFVPLDPEHPFQARLRELRNDRRSRNIRLVELLHSHGFSRLTYEDLLSRAKSEYSLGRPHFAQAMFDHHPEIVGTNSSENWARLFKDWLGQGGKAYLKKTEMTIEDMVEAAQGAGVVFSIAHATLNYYSSTPSEAQLDATFPAILQSLKARGVKGVECYYGSWHEERRQHMLKLTRDAGMIPTGGSDYHGLNKSDVRLGHGLTGDLRVPDTVLDEMRAARF